MGGGTARAHQSLQSSWPMMESATKRVRALCCLAGKALVKKGYFHFHSSSQVHTIHTQDASSPRYEVTVHLKLRADVNDRVLH